MRAVAGVAAAAVLIGLASSQALGWLGGGEDRWSAPERAQLASLHRAEQRAQPEPSNRFADDPAAVRLGQQLFNDRRLSRTGSVACASCHRPEGQFEDGRPRGIGIAEGSRRTMPAIDLAGSPWFFWDGRKDSLWSQALGPLEDAKEHGGNRLHYARLLQQHYRPAYEALFGPLPDLRGLPEDAGPQGSDAERTAWQSLPESRRVEISRAFANIGKAIAAYESTLRYGETRVDRYIDAVVRGDDDGLAQLQPAEKAGLRLFIGKAQCITCHNGPQLTDRHFHNTGVPPLDPAHPEAGRSEAVKVVIDDEFNCLGKYSDAKPGQCEELQFIAKDDPGLRGAFKTPGLRNVALRPPYMHAGQFATLSEVLQHYARAPEARVGRSELGRLMTKRLTDGELQQLEALLRAFSGPVIQGSEADR
ncbi:MAG: cytochrome-c peroxidase [Rhizobacter sp.]